MIANLIEITDLKGTNKLNAKPDSFDTELFDELVAEKQDFYLKTLLGDNLVIDLEANITVPKWVEFLDGVRYDEINDEGNTVKVDYRGFKNLLAFFIFYWFKLEVAQIETTSGTAMLATENTVLVNPAAKMTTSYNRGIDLYGFDWEGNFISNNGRFIRTSGGHRFLRTFTNRLRNPYLIPHRKFNFIDENTAKLQATAYNYIRNRNEADANNFLNWEFTQIEKINKEGI